MKIYCIYIYSYVINSKNQIYEQFHVKFLFFIQGNTYGYLLSQSLANLFPFPSLALLTFATEENKGRVHIQVNL